MASFNLVKSSCVPLTEELAEEFRGMDPSPTERGLQPARVKHLRDKLKSGLFVPCHWAKAKLGKKWLRMNGQHSSIVLSEANGDFPEGLTVHLDEYEVDSADGLALLFRQFDDRKSSRSSADVAGAYQGLYPDLQDIPGTSAKLAIEGVVWYRRSVEGIPVPSGDSQYELFGEKGLHSFIQWVGDVFTIKTPELRKAPIVSAMYATFIIFEEEAKNFWELVAKGGKEFDDQHPTTVLSCWYVRAKGKELKNVPKPAEYYQAALYAWKAYREEKTISSVRIDMKKGLLSAED